MAAADRHVVLATAGHVDHGKTSLIRALTGTDTDRLPEEKRRGISIELGFAELEGTPISFIDVPGHRKLVHTMIAGVGGVDGVLLVVAADDAVMPQTREHLHVCSLLGVERVVVALAKCDLVDAETLELAEADVRSTLSELGLRPSAVVACSVVTGAGIDELRRALLQLAGDVAERTPSARAWLALDRVFTIKGAGTVVTGTLTRGGLALGTPAWIVGAGGVQETACRGLEVHGRAVTAARAPCRVAVNLARLDAAAVARGDVLTLDPLLPRSRRLDVALRTLPGTERALAERRPVVVHVGTARVTGRILWHAPGLAQLLLDHELACEGGVGLILRGFATSKEHGAVLAGGRILDAAAPPPARASDASARERRAGALIGLRGRDWPAAVRALLELAAPRALAVADVERRLGLEPGAVVDALAGRAVALDGGRLQAAPDGIAALGTEIERFLERHHAAHPHEPGPSLETVRAELARRAGREPAEHAVAEAARAGRVRLLEQGLVCLPRFASETRASVEQSAARLLEALAAAGLQGASDAELGGATGEPAENVKARLARLSAQKSARRLGGLWFLEARLDALRAAVRAHLAEHGSISVPAFKDLAGVSRKQAIPLLEQLDREGTTRREGDLRVLGARAS